MAIQHIYDGKNTAVTLPSGERLDRAQSGMNDLILQAEKMKLDSFKKNEEWFLNSQDVDIETFLSAANTETQAKLIDEYNNKAQNILKARGGDFNNLTTQDKLELSKGRKVLESEQQRMLGDLEKFKMAREVVTKNQDKYSLEEANELIFKPYITTGKFNDEPLPIKAKSFDAYLDNNKVPGDVTTEYEYYTNEFGTKVKQPKKVIGTKEQAKSFIKNRILSDEANRKDVFNQFKRQPLDVQLQYLDNNPKDGKISANELGTPQDLQSEENPIIRWAQETKWKNARKVVEGGESGAAPSKASVSFDWNIGVGEGHNNNGEFTVVKDKSIGATKFNSYLQLGEVPNSQKTMRIGKYIDLNSGKEVALNDIATFQPVGYSPDKDMIIVAMKSKYSGVPDITAGLDGTEYDEFLKRKPFGIDRASLIKKQPATSTKGILD